MTEPFLRDPDVTLDCGDVLDVLRDLPAESVDCCVTSPPYWGLRDYGTGAWEGGDQDCDHLGPPFRTKSKLNENWGAGFSDAKNADGRCDCPPVEGRENESCAIHHRPSVVLDPFVGPGTTALVARNHGRHAIGIDLNAKYLELAARRLQQLSLLAETS